MDDRRGCVVSILLLVSVITSHAQTSQEYKVTKIGKWTCVMNYAPGSLWGGCEANVTFDEPHFGSKPNVIASMSNIPKGISELTVEQATVPTETGFSVRVTSMRTGDNDAVGQQGSITASGTWTAVGFAAEHTTITPKYIVLSVVYAPPGGNGGGTPTSVTYQSGSTTSTKVSASNSFKESYSVSVKASVGDVEADSSFGFSKSSTDEQSLNIQHSLTESVTYPGPKKDDIDHDFDQIVLWLNPQLDLSLTPLSGTWELIPSRDKKILPVFVGYLNGRIPIPDKTKQFLLNYGITEAEYGEIASRDPLAGGAKPEPSRFMKVVDSIAYQPPLNKGDAVTTHKVDLSDNSTSTVIATKEETYDVGLDLSVGAGAKAIAQTVLKNSQKWTWTNKSSRERSNGSSNSASANVAGPAFGHPLQFLDIYVDLIYRTFAFALIGDHQTPLVHGKVLSADGKPVAWTEVRLFEPDVIHETNTTAGRIHKTFTNELGEYRFFGEIVGPVRLQAGSSDVPMILPQQTATVIKLK